MLCVGVCLCDRCVVEVLFHVNLPFGGVQFKDEEGNL